MLLTPLSRLGQAVSSRSGFLYYEILELIDGITNKGKIVGMDLVEVAPDYDLTTSTTTLAARSLNAIGRILYYRKN